MNTHRSKHIITIEDPIEFLYRHERCIINQRQVNDDTNSFHEALRRVLRQDPDIVLIGEMRDFTSIEAAMTMAETGHLVFATLHTSDAVSTVTRIIDVFPTEQQQQARVQLSMVLVGVMAQQLLPRKGGGRVLAQEIFKANAAARNHIRENEVHQMYSIMETGRAEGMKTMNMSLFELFKDGIISREQAINKATNIEQMKRMMSKGAPMAKAGGAKAAGPGVSARQRGI